MKYQYKTRLHLVFLFAATLLLGSCSKDDSGDKKTEYPVENPLAAYLAASGFDQHISATSYEKKRLFGLRFTPKVKGQLNAIILQLPGDAESVRVALWKEADQSVIESYDILDLKKDVKKRQTITPLNLEVGVTYLISFYSDITYIRTRNDESDTDYPITIGNLSIEGVKSDYIYAYPKGYTYDAYFGDISFEFQQVD